MIPPTPPRAEAISKALIPDHAPSVYIAMTAHAIAARKTTHSVTNQCSKSSTPYFAGSAITCSI